MGAYAAESNQFDLRGHRVLAVDDDPGILNFLSDYLEGFGIQVVIAQDGESGIEQARRARPDLILLDVLMPGIGGFETCLRLKGDPTTKGIPVIFMTAVIEPQDKVRGFQSGAVDYVTKPLEQEEFLARVTTHLRLRWLTEHLEQQVRQRTQELAEANQQLQKEIAERKQTEEALRESEELHRITIENILDPVFITDDDGAFTFICANIPHVLGYGVEETRAMGNISKLLGDHLFDLEELNATGEIHNIETVIVDKQGTNRFFLVTVKRVSIKGGTILYTCHDITERKQIERSLRESEERFRVLYEDMPSMYFMLDVDGTVLSVNRFGARHLGYSVEELNGRPVLEIFHPDDREDVRKQLAICLRKVSETAHWEFRKIRKNGDTMWVRETARVVSGHLGKRVVLVVCQDITGYKRSEEERRRLEGQLRHAQKMEAIGTLAGGIAHDFNNILSAIIGYAEIIEMFDDPKDSPLRAHVREVLRAADRAQHLVRQILTISRRSEQELKPVQLSHLIKEALNFLRAALPTTIEIRRNIQAQADAVLCDPTQMHQVLMNLCTNAAHAMRDRGGVLTVELKAIDLDEEAGKGYLDLHPGGYLKLTVTDTGCGIDPQVMDRIFEPYFTTKEQGEGTGLGLAVVHGIVRSLGGAITAVSEVGKGASFDVLIPRLEPERTVSSEKLSPPVTGANERILCVDDEKTIAGVQELMLRRLGYHVVTRTDAIEALEIVRRNPQQFDLLITDLTMPRMTGIELVEQVRKIRPDLSIILCTGYYEAVQPERALALGIKAVLQKPVKIHDMADAVSKALNS